MNDRKGMAYDSGDLPGTFESGRCAGCGVLLDDAGIIMARPTDPWVRLARWPWEQESCGERTCRCPTGGWPQEVWIAWAAGLASLTSIVLGEVLSARGEALNKVSNLSGGLWVAWAVFFIALPFLAAAAVIVAGIVRELCRDLRRYGA